MVRAAATILLAIAFLGTADADDDDSVDTGKHGATMVALPHAARADNLAEVQRLLAAGSGVDLREGRDGLAALHYAAKQGNKAILEVLLDAGAMVDVESVRGMRTPLMLAAAHGHTQIVSALLERGANVNAEDVVAETALMVAVQAEQKKAVFLLLGYGAEADTENQDGVSVRVRNFSTVLAHSKLTPKVCAQITGAANGGGGLPGADFSGHSRDPRQAHRDAQHGHRGARRQGLCSQTPGRLNARVRQAVQLVK